MTSQGSPYARFRRAVQGRSAINVRAAAAELPRIGVEHAALILLFIERVEPHKYEQAARRWIVKLCEEPGSRVDLGGIAQAAMALDALPDHRLDAYAMLVQVCERAGLRDAARVFSG